ncbi:MAG: trypsin-like peptidase domain-containing protein [Actinobacteria bacterium]|nr:trypsin-like peptidase domain-containing protein [Actinomycetota bacterium]
MAEKPVEPVEPVEPVAPAAPVEPVASRRRSGWLVPLIAALVGSLVGGGLVALLQRDPNGRTIRYGRNSSVLVNPRDVQGVLAKVEPAVVSVRTEAFQRGGLFFNEVQRVRGAGTGMILSAGGDVLTNSHVVEGATTITVSLQGEKDPRPADLVSRDATTDIAVIRIRDAHDLPSVKLGDSDKLVVGDDVLAIGNALDLVGGPTVTRGIVSALNRTLGDDGSGERFTQLIQTDAAINNGNSGGPLVNTAGEVVGMNTVVIQSTGTGNSVQNIGFAISVNAIKPIVSELKGGKSPVRSTTFMGATLATLTDALKDRLGLATGSGVLVNDVVAASPAENAGLRSGDVIVKFDGQDVKEASAVVSAVQKHKPGDKVEVEYLRGNDKRNATVTLGSRQANSA